MQSLPKVSVLIPAFNEEKYIERVLSALMVQDYPNFEVVVCNNHSTDNTAAVASRFIQSLTVQSIEIRLVHEDRQGTNFARECARRQAAGSVIAQLDADCVPAADWLRKGVYHLCKGKRVAVTGPYDYFDCDSRMRSLSLFSQKLFYPITSALAQLAGRAAILIGGNAFIRAEILELAGGYNTTLTFYGDDIELGARLSRFGEVAYVNRLVQQSSSRRYKADGFWKVNKKYQAAFWRLVRNRPLYPTIELHHPR